MEETNGQSVTPPRSLSRKPGSSQATAAYLEKCVLVILVGMLSGVVYAYRYRIMDAFFPPQVTQAPEPVVALPAPVPQAPPAVPEPLPVVTPPPQVAVLAPVAAPVPPPPVEAAPEPPEPVETPPAAVVPPPPPVPTEVVRVAPEPVKPSAPSTTGALQIVTASLLGGPHNDEIVGAEITKDHAVILLGNAVDLKVSGGKQTLLGPPGALQQASPPGGAKADKNWVHPSTYGFLLRLGLDGKTVQSYTRFGYGQATLKGVKQDAQGNLYVLGDAKAALSLGAASGTGTFVAAFTPDGQRILSALFHPGIIDFGVDSNGEVVVLAGARMTRYGADGKTQKWTVTWKAHGGNRPGGMTVSPQTGVAAVVGYGMTHTGKEPWKDPFGYGFDREGKQLWALWNPDPGREKGGQFGGNGLMADTTGKRAGVAVDGKIFFMLYADGGNSVCTRDPADPDKKIDPTVYAGVHQGGPGYGFKGASSTAVIFRIDPLTGKLEKGTWMSAWLTPARANGLNMDEAVGDEQGNVFLVGGSAFGCPTKNPWFTAVEGGYKGGGFLAYLDRDFKMVQCGYFPMTSIKCVGYRDGYVVIGGSASDSGGTKPGVADVVDHVRLAQPMQDCFGGDRDGYFALFKVVGK